MNDSLRPDDPGHREDAELDADAKLARDALRDLSPVVAEPAFRAGLKAAFSSREMPGLVARGDSPGDRESPIVPLPFPGRHRLWTGIAVVAALLIAVVTGVLNQGPSWRVAGVRGEGAILLDGESHAAADTSLVGKRIPPGVRIEVPAGAEVDLLADGVMAMQCVGGTDLILPPSPPRWFGRHSALHLQEGEIRVTTGPAFRGANLQITTPDAAIAVTGTTFAVILERTGTCVCVLEGTVSVGPRGTAPAPVSSGNLRYVFRDGRPPTDSEMRDAEKLKLGAFRGSSIPGLELSAP